MTRRGSNRERPRGLAVMFAVPAALFVVSLTGLVAALLKDGGLDTLFALAAGAGILALAWAIFWKRN
ncbi:MULTISPECIES: hypothetical protein [unclassified Hyphomonas]|uniref:hypothetical protein n=1 Tax=unclassified Hyphomonas TaxID=2630699 RepID=UPI000458BB14|nr:MULTISPECIES: hypothetical protein [unclassified Hyphomonas]KCZ46674.1 hypothetical protein HY17_07975 [Hyphomonas sp. CY54-11-8]